MNIASLEQVAGAKCGEIVAGKYRILRVIGAGGMGYVVAAEHIQLGEKVAIKFLNSEGNRDAGVVARFTQEARAAVRIRNEHVARVIDVATLDSGAPYIVMEYLDGADLSDTVERAGRLDAQTAVGYVLQACEAIAEAHAAGIVHRDLKPANLFCVKRADGTVLVKVLDFGISKLLSWNDEHAAAAVTTTSAVFGTPLYMSPEQMRSTKDVDGRADIWSIGVILYELLTGKAPFNGDSLPQICTRIACEPPPPISAEELAIPKDLVRIILKCLEKDRAKRYPNIADLAADLLPYGPKHCGYSVERIIRTIESAGLGRTRTPEEQPFDAKAMSELGTVPPAVARTHSLSVRRRFWFSSAVGLVIGLTGLLVVWVLHRAGTADRRIDGRTYSSTALAPIIPPTAEALRTHPQTFPIAQASTGTTDLSAPAVQIPEKQRRSRALRTAASVSNPSPSARVDPAVSAGGPSSHDARTYIATPIPATAEPSKPIVPAKKWGGRL